MTSSTAVEPALTGLASVLSPVVLVVVLAVLVGGAAAWLGERIGLRDAVLPTLVRTGVVTLALWFGWEAIAAAWLPWARHCWGGHASPARVTSVSSHGEPNESIGAR